MRFPFNCLIYLACSLGLSACGSVTIGGLASIAAIGGGTYYANEQMKWQVHEEALGDDRYRIHLRKHALASSGHGEDMLLFRQRAQSIVDRKGCADYQIIEFTSGLESVMLGSEQTSRGTILCRGRNLP